MAEQSAGAAAGAAGAEGGLIGNARRLARTLLAILSTRLELLGVEVAEQGARIGALMALGVVALLFSIFAVGLFSFGVAVLFWDSYRLTAIFGLALLYAVIVAVAVWQIRARIKDHPEPFAATIAELKADAAALGRR
jgi:uncharacterized membrane protein YqjE